MSKKAIWIIIVAIALLVGGFLLFGALQRGRLGSALLNLQTEVVQRGELELTVTADGLVRSNQTALLVWKTSGTVEDVPVALGERVAAGQELASLQASSLPQPVILAQAELVSAHQALDELRRSNTRAAQAQQAVELAQRDLEEGQSADLPQADALAALAEAQKSVESAERALYILTHPPSAAVLDQAKASLLQAETVLNRTLENIDLYEMKASKPRDSYIFWEIRSLYKMILENLELKRLNDQKAYDRALKKYTDLQEPPDPDDVTLAEASLALAKSRLVQAQRQWDRVADGSSPADIAVLQARLDDARREAERWRDGPAAEEVLAAEARLAAAQAAVQFPRLEAPFAGTITQVSIQPGDQVRPGTLAFRLDDQASMFAEVLVSEVDINRVRLGQPARLRLEAVPGREYQGVVVDVPEVGEEVQGLISFRVEIQFTEPDPLVKPGMTATATIIVEELPAALLVPNKAVRLSEGQRVVYRIQEGQVAPVAITLGAASEQYSQVTEGDLQPGDQVLLDPPAELVAGGGGRFRPRLMMRLSR